MNEKLQQLPPHSTAPPPIDSIISRKNRIYIIVAALMVLFLSALDSLIVGAAMPTIVSDLGGLPLYGWVFSSYMLSRAVALPIFGKLSDLFQTKTLYNIAIGLFLAASVFAGISRNMEQLILARLLQGIGSGGCFALVYIVLADISPPEQRGKMMSISCFIWGLASVMGPTLGGIIVNYFSWRWIFFINLPVGALSLFWISLYLTDTREKRKTPVIDYSGILALTATILGILFIFLLGGEKFAWLSPQIMGIGLITVLSGIAFYHIEKHAEEPILSIRFFNVPGFNIGNISMFFSCFAYYSLAAFLPLFIQGALGKTPAQMGVAMVPLSLGWSVGALLCGYIVNRIGSRSCAIVGALSLMAGCGLSLTFSPDTSLVACFLPFTLSGFGMGFVSISTLLMVQNSLDSSDLGVATSSHQFTRTLSGTIGMGISGSLVTARLPRGIDTLVGSDPTGLLPLSIANKLRENIDNLFQPDIQSILTPVAQKLLHGVIADSVMMVFWAAMVAAASCLVFSYFLPKRQKNRSSIFGP